ncbi:MAG TPA: TIM barrel protein [Abditibacteriaceae bacterium]
MNRISVSSWSLHPNLGAPPIWGVGGSPQVGGDGEFSLIELPQRLADFGIQTFELCHFHLPSLETEYLAQMRAAIESAGVELWSLLVDSGDLTGAHADRDEAWIATWFPIAQQLGARNVRVIAGKGAPTSENLTRSRAALARLAQQAARHNVRILTENWFDLLSTPEAVHSLFDGLDVGLNLDFGNWSGDDKYRNLEKIASLAEGTHAKAHFENEVIDEADFVKCLELLMLREYAGPYSLVCDNASDRWRALEEMKTIAIRFLV